MKEDDENTPMGDSVNDVDLTNKNPADDDKKPKDDELTAEALDAIAGEDDDDAPRDESGRFVPRARVDELTAQRNAERERATAAEAKAAELQRQRDEDAEAARVAAEKAKQVRDFDAERATLDKQYDDNEIDAAKHRADMRALDKAEREQDRRIAKEEAVAEVEQRLAKQREEAEAKTAEQIAADAGEAAKRFIEDPANAEYKTDPIRIAALNQMREVVFAEKKGNIDWDDLLAESKKRVEEYLTGKKAPAETDQVKVARERREAQARVTAAAAALPGRPEGGQGARGAGQNKDDGEELTREEWNALPKAERDRRLGRTA